MRYVIYNTSSPRTFVLIKQKPRQS
uniref:Uncharacterized protein n=1 Tax=Arundo donax TaxID=35708 RepID=A0A0A9A943_ARUDO